VRRYRWIFWTMASVSAVLAVRFAFRFPWTPTLQALRGADVILLLAAGTASLGSLVAKGWAWHLLLRRAWPHGWWDAQAATLVGAAVSTASVSVGGEAARLQTLAARREPPLGTTVSSVVWSRITEAIALAVFLAGSLLLLPPGPWTRAAGVSALVGIGLLLALRATGAWRRVFHRLPERWRTAAGIGSATGTPPLVAPVLLGLANWVLQWLAYHATIVAVGIEAPPAAALTALVAANLGGILRLTPGNLGVLQASVVMGLLPFDVRADQSLAAGLALQGVQVIPTILAALAVGGVGSLRPAVRTTAAGIGAGSGRGDSEG
jgi:putative heme transporter